MNYVFAWPVGHDPESSRPQRPPMGPVVGYVAGATAGGAATGVVLALPQAIIGMTDGCRGVAWLAALAIVALAVREQLRGRMGHFPERRAQVPRRWLTWRHRAVTATAFGLMIGSGVLTLLHHATAYVLGLALLLAPSPLAGVAVGSIYGAARGAMLVLAWVLRVGPAQLGTWRGEVVLTVPAVVLAVGAALTAAALTTFAHGIL